MTEFVYMSDIHLEFGHMPAIYKVSGDNLILAGDITILGCLDPRMNDARSRKLRDRTLKFFEIACENFKKVFYVTGNHESYNFNIAHEADLIKKYLPGVIHLQNKSVEFDDNTVIMGGTLWTDFNKNDPLAHFSVQNYMNDFKIIFNEDRVWTTNDAAASFATTKSFLEDELRKYNNKKVVVVTHHAPAFCGINPAHTMSGYTNFGYYSDLSEFILDHPQIKYWVYGHTHKQGIDEIGSAKLVTNAQGYIGYEDQAARFNIDTRFVV